VSELLQTIQKITIPPTEVGGWFKSNLLETTNRVLESHQRKLVDCSDPTYKEKPDERMRIPPTAVWGDSDSSSRFSLSMGTELLYNNFHGWGFYVSHTLARSESLTVHELSTTTLTGTKPLGQISEPVAPVR
jgi:hypothetical protein